MTRIKMMTEEHQFKSLNEKNVSFVISRSIFSEFTWTHPTNV